MASGPIFSSLSRTDVTAFCSHREAREVRLATHHGHERAGRHGKWFNPGTDGKELSSMAIVCIPVGYRFVSRFSPAGSPSSGAGCQVRHARGVRAGAGQASFLLEIS